MGSPTYRPFWHENPFAGPKTPEAPTDTAFKMRSVRPGAQKRHLFACPGKMGEKPRAVMLRVTEPMSPTCWGLQRTLIESRTAPERPCTY